MADNPYKGSGGSDDIKSDVQGLAVCGPNGKPMDLAGQELSMFVKRDLINDLPLVPHRYTNEGAMNVHRFNFTSETNSMVIEVRPTDPNIQTHIYLSYEKRPTVSNIIFNYTLVKLKDAKLMKKLPDPFIRVFLADDLNGTGEYHIGIKLTPGRNAIFAEYGYNPILNYTIRTWETVCKLWDEELKTFSTDGCVVSIKLFCLHDINIL